MKSLVIMLLAAAGAFAADLPMTSEAVPPGPAAPIKCVDGSMLGFNSDGHVCWGAEYDAVAVVAMKSLSELNQEKLALTVQLDAMTKEVIRLKSQSDRK